MFTKPKQFSLDQRVRLANSLMELVACGSEEDRKFFESLVGEVIGIDPDGSVHVYLLIEELGARDIKDIKLHPSLLRLDNDLSILLT
jgi:hypothetical protein